MAPEGSDLPDIPVDDQYDAGSGYYNDDDDALTYSSGRTLASTIRNYRYENGRRYHAFREGEYYQPNDEKQNDYQLIVHHLWMLTLDDQLFIAPVEFPGKILDLGTGRGIWAIDVGDRYPSAEVIGTDLSPTQDNFAPPNVHFEIDDMCSEWTYPENSFDLIHMRMMSGCVSDWTALYQQCLKHLAPGGWFEQHEYVTSVNLYSNNNGNNSNTDSAKEARYKDVLLRVQNIMLEGGVKMGKEFTVAERIADRMRAVGFVDVHQKKYVWPIGPWAADARLKEVGRWNQRQWEEGIEGWILAICTRFHGMTYDEVRLLIEDVKKAVRDRSTKAYNEVYVVYGRKPTS